MPRAPTAVVAPSGDSEDRLRLSTREWILPSAHRPTSTRVNTARTVCCALPTGSELPALCPCAPSSSSRSPSTFASLLAVLQAPSPQERSQQAPSARDVIAGTAARARICPGSAACLQVWDCIQPWRREVGTAEGRAVGAPAPGKGCPGTDRARGAGTWGALHGEGAAAWWDRGSRSVPHSEPSALSPGFLRAGALCPGHTRNAKGLAAPHHLLCLHTPGTVQGCESFSRPTALSWQ